MSFYDCFHINVNFIEKNIMIGQVIIKFYQGMSYQSSKMRNTYQVKYNNTLEELIEKVKCYIVMERENIEDR